MQRSFFPLTGGLLCAVRRWVVHVRRKCLRGELRGFTLGMPLLAPCGAAFVCDVACYQPWVRELDSVDRGHRRLPCGKCEGCLLERSRQWAVRCMHEASLHEANSFITLTYSDEHVPVGGTLDREAMPLFFKRLRKKARVRYFQCGEYGSLTRRPHYHALVFGFGFPDRAQWAERRGLPVWRSELLERLWPFGLSELSDVTFESAAYVARYCVKKLARAERERVALDTGELYEIEPEYATMSRSPGLGRGWIDKFQGDVFPSDEVVSRGAVMKPPRYYVDVVEAKDPEVVSEVRRKRFLLGLGRMQENGPLRLPAREVCARSRLNSFKREL